jgi:hypothetical protein
VLDIYRYRCLGKGGLQKALDVVRVIGNQAVHPGVMDLKDKRETAGKLFELINLIAHDRITYPKEVDALYSSLPAPQIAQITKRDAAANPKTWL